jgi:hypothetical protein
MCVVWYMVGYECAKMQYKVLGLTGAHMKVLDTV